MQEAVAKASQAVEYDTADKPEEAIVRVVLRCCLSSRELSCVLDAATDSALLHSALCSARSCRAPLVRPRVFPPVAVLPRGYRDHEGAG